jgi:hypothetical protein
MECGLGSWQEDIMSEKKYEVISLEGLTEHQELVMSIVMREGALRFKEHLIAHLKDLAEAAGNFDFIKEVENFDEDEAIK